MRTETFCIEFKTQEAFTEFWDKYSKSMLPDGDNSQFQMLSCGTGNYISKHYRILKLLGLVYDAFNIYDFYTSLKSGRDAAKMKIMEIADKVVEYGDFSDERFVEIGGMEKLDELEKEVR